MKSFNRLKRKNNYEDINNKSKRQKYTTYDSIQLKIPKKSKIDCVVCMDKFDNNMIVKIHNNHFNMCKNCLLEQANVLLRNRDLLPWKCSSCKEELSLDIFKNIISQGNYNKLLNWQMENIIGKSVSCYNCDSSFCIPNNFKIDSITCNICNNKINVSNSFHKENIQELLDLANSQNWAQCPGCNELIEKIDGCNHMSHRENDNTTTHFCYQCNMVLDKNYIDENGRNHFPDGSYQDCITTINRNTNRYLTNIQTCEHYENSYYQSDSEYESNSDDDDDDDDDSIYYCTECSYYGYSENALQQHINAKSHHPMFYCRRCNYVGYSQNGLIQHRNAKYH